MSENVQNIHHKLHFKGNEKLETVGVKTLAEVRAQGGIFQRDSLSPLLFVRVIMQLHV